MIKNNESIKVLNIVKGSLHPGAWYCMEFLSDAKPTKKAAEMGLEIVKKSSCIARFGLDYLHLKSF